MLIQITDPFLLPDGTNWTGTIIYTLLYATTLDGATVVGAQQAIQVTNGISIQLAPGLYTVQMNQSGLREVYAAQWGVPVSGGPYTIAEISSNVSLQGSFGGVVLSGTPTTGQVPTATSPTAATWQMPSGGGLLQSNTVTISSSQLLSNAPIILVPAAGSGMVVFPFAVRIKLTFGTRRYSAFDSGPYLWWQDKNNAAQEITPGGYGSQALAMSVVLASSTSAFYISGLGSVNSISSMGGVGFDPSAYDNQPIVLQEEAGGFTLNNGAVQTAVPTTAGTGYVVGDELNPMSAGQTGDAILTVSGVDGSGGITGVNVSTPGAKNNTGSSTTENLRNITSATVAAGGTGYAIGDTGVVLAGNDDAIYTVTSVGSLGAVTGVNFTAGGGTAYSQASGITTQVITGAGDGALTLNTVVGSGSGAVLDLTVLAGDGTLLVTTWYTVAPL